MPNKPTKTSALDIFRDSGITMLPDNEVWAHRFQIKSGTASRLYVIGKLIETGVWVCTCPGFRAHKHCKHMSAVSGVTSAVDKVDGIKIMLTSRWGDDELNSPMPDDDMFTDISPGDRPFSNAGYRHYDTESGLGSSDEWARKAEDILSKIGVNSSDYTTYASDTWSSSGTWSHATGGQEAYSHRHPLNSHINILGLDDIPDTLAEFKKLARKRIMETHPDHGGNSNEFRVVFAAYEKISWDVFKIRV